MASIKEQILNGTYGTTEKKEANTSSIRESILNGTYTSTPKNNIPSKNKSFSFSANDTPTIEELRKQQKSVKSQMNKYEKYNVGDVLKSFVGISTSYMNNKEYKKLVEQDKELVKQIKAYNDSQKQSTMDKIGNILAGGFEKGYSGITSTINKILPGKQTGMKEQFSELSNQAIVQTKNPIGKTVLGILGSVSQMSPQMLVGGGIPSYLIGFANYGGNAYNDAIKEGKTESQATKYGIVIGGLEMGLQKLLGSTLGKTYSKSKLDKTISGAMSKLIKNKTIRETISGATGEFTEEYLQDILNTVVRNVTLDENNKFKPFTAEALASGVQGALTSGVLDLTRGRKIQNIDIPQNVQNKAQEQTNSRNNINIPIKQEQAPEIPNLQNNDKITSQLEPTQSTFQKVNNILPTETKSQLPQIQGVKTSNLEENFKTSDIIDKEFKKFLPDMTYNPITNKETMEEAKSKLDNNLDDEVVRLFNLDETQATPTDIAELIQLQSAYQKQGNIQSFQESVNKLRKIGTSVGQATQAFAILQRMTPEGMIYYAQRDLQDIYETVSKNKSKKWIEQNKEKYNLTDQEINDIKNKMIELQNTTDERQRRVLIAKVQKVINDKIPANIGNEIKSYRRISMLFNAKTQVRNIIGNASILPLNVASDFIGSKLDKVIANKTGIRTIAPYKAEQYGKGFVKGAKEVIQDAKMGIDTSGMDTTKFEIGKGNNFNNNTKVGKALNKIDKINSTMLRLGDNPFFQAEFNNSLKNQMLLNNKIEPTADMVDIAEQTALERTWQDNNNYTQAVLSIRKAMNKVNFKGFGLGDVIVPFAKTPANITKAMVDYSPLGLVKSLTLDLKNFKNNLDNNTATTQIQRKLVNNISKGISGSLVYLLAYGLKDMISGGADKDKDIRDFMRNTMGVNPYSIKIGNKTYTYDWLQPVATPFAIVADSKNNNKDKSVFEKVLSTLGTAGDRLIEQSFLQGISDLFSNIGSGNFEGMLKGTIEDLPSSFVPTLVKQVSDITDKYTKLTYGQDLIGNIKRSITNKIPILSSQEAKKYDTLGREVLKYGGDNNIFNSFINPSNVNKEKNNEVGKEILDIYKETGDKTIFPRVAPTYIITGGEKISLTTKEQSEFQKISGETTNTEITKLLNNADYISMSNDEKVKTLKNIVDYSYNKARKETLNIDMPQEYNQVNGFIEIGGNVSDYYSINTLNSNVYNADNYKSEEKKNKIITNILNTDYSSEQKLYLYNKYYAGDKKIEAIKKTGIKSDTYLELQKRIIGIKAIDDPKSNVEGKVKSGSKKAQVVKEIQKLSTSRINKLMLYAMEGYSLTPKEKTEIFNHINKLGISKTEKQEIIKEMDSFQWLENGKLKGW